MADLADQLSAARRSGDPAPEEIERIVDLLSRNDMDPGERLSRAVESLARWAEDERPALRGAVPPAPRRDDLRHTEPRQPELREELEDRLADFAKSLVSQPATSVRQSAQELPQIPSKPQIQMRPQAPATPPVASLRAALAEIAARQKSLDDDYEPAPARPAAPRAPQPVDPSVLRELRSELDTLGASIAELPTRSEIDSLTREMTTLASKIGSERPAQLDGASLKAIDALVSEVDRMRSEAPSPQAISSLSEELHAISARLDVIGPRNSDAIDALARRIEEVRSELDHFPRVSAVDEVAAEIKSIIVRLDAQERAASPTRDAVAGLTGHVHALDGRLSAMADAAVKRDDALQRINDTIRAELDSLPRAEAVTDLGRQIDALTEGLKSRSAIGPALKAVEGLAGKVDALDGKFANVRQDSFDILGRQIETLNANLATRGADAMVAPVQALSGKLDALGDRMETMTTATRQRGAAFERIEESVRTIAEQLLASRNGTVAGPTLEKEASRLLERLQSTDGRMDDLHAAFAGLASRIERSCEDLGAKAAQTAIAAARDTLGAETSGGRLDGEIAQALSDMRSSATQSERRAADALEAVRSTLDKLLDRMERIGAPAYNHTAALEQALQQPARVDPLGHKPVREEPLRQEPLRQEPLRQEPARRADAAEATRTAARRAMAEIEAGEPAQTVRPPFADVDPDQPLEPGARPTLGGHETAASLIAAARRANTQSAPEFTAEPVSRVKSERKSFVSGAISSLKARRRPLLLGIAATLIVFAALYVASGMTGAPVEEAAPAPAPQSRLAPKTEPKIAYQSEPASYRADRAVEAEKDYQAAKSYQSAKDFDSRLDEPRSADASTRDLDAPRRVATTRDDAAHAPTETAKDPSSTRNFEAAAAPDASDAKASAADVAPPRAPARDLTSFAFADGAAKPRANEWQAGEPVTTGSIARVDQAGLPEQIGGQLLRSRAAAGDAAAQLEIGDRLLEGRKVEADPAAAAKWFEKAASQGLAPAQQRLGSLYEKGRGVPRDVPTARRWYEQAAASGNVRAMHNLGVIHAEGGLGKPDYSAAVVWFRMASDRGLVDSQYNLAVLNARGLGGKRDLVGAYKWFSLAAQQGDDDAGRKRDDVAKALGGQLSVAKAEVAAFRARDVDASANEVPPAPGGGWDRVAERRDEGARVR